MNPVTNQPDIDFLPARYREQHVRRRLNVWRLAVVVSFGSLVGMGALHQWTVRWAVERELATTLQRYEAQKESIGKLNLLDDGLKQAQAEAQLFAFLVHPWPRTQILAAVLQPLSPEIHLSELRIIREVIERTKTGPQQQPPSIDPNAPPVEADPSALLGLAALRKELESTEIAVLLEGTVESADALQRYLSAVTKSPLVAAAELQSLSANQEGGTLFKVRIEIVPGVGQPGGPEPPLEARAAGEVVQ